MFDVCAAVGFDFVTKHPDKIHGIQQPIGQKLRIGDLAVTHGVHQILACMQHPGQFRQIKQPAVAFQGMDKAEQLRHQLTAGRVFLQLHQFFSDTLQRFP